LLISNATAGATAYEGLNQAIWVSVRIRREDRSSIVVSNPLADLGRRESGYIIDSSPSLEQFLCSRLMTTARLAQVPRMRRFSANGANAEGGDPDEDSSPEQMLLELSPTEVAELIERHVEYVNKKLDEVHLDSGYVSHFIRRARDPRDGDDMIPVVSAVATLPVVFADGSVLAQREGLDREFGIVFHIPPELMEVLPECDIVNGQPKWICVWAWAWAFPL
jgi:hypothetical protein